MEEPKEESTKNIRIDKVKYERVKLEMVRALKRKALTYSELMEEMKVRLKGFDGSVKWYSEMIKVDLLSQKVIEKLTSRPVKYALV